MSLEQLQHRFITLSPSSRDDMKSRLEKLLADESTVLIDTHNTTAMIFVFTCESQRFALKVEFGEAKVVRDEAHWYAKTPEHLRQHFITSAIESSHAFILLRWFDQARTVEEVSRQSDTTNPAVTALIDALTMDAELFDTFDTVPLTVGADSSFFRDKFYAKVQQAQSHHYLHDFLHASQVVLNERVLPGPIRLLQHIHAEESLREYLSPNRAGFIHGDLHADNLIVVDGAVHLVDPNGLDYMPIEYDHGRVLWSLTGWNAIVRHEHQLTQASDGSYQLTVPIQAQYKDGRERVDHYFREYSTRAGLEPGQALHRARYSSAVQYLSRADHAAVEHEAMALHLHGLEQLVELLDELGAPLK